MAASETNKLKMVSTKGFIFRRMDQLHAKKASDVQQMANRRRQLKLQVSVLQTAAFTYGNMRYNNDRLLKVSYTMKFKS